jgi:SEC-C motif-containing protein
MHSPAPLDDADDSPCPCGSGGSFADCCGPVLEGRAPASSAEALMRSRFTAFARGDTGHLLRSWAAETRPPSAELEDPDAQDLHWQRLRILDAVAGGADDETGVVEFVAIARGGAGKVRLHERSRFRRIPELPGWVYVDGDVQN